MRAAVISQTFARNVTEKFECRSVRVSFHSLQMLLNFCFYALFIPYRIVLDEYGKYKTHSSPLQKILCTILNVLCCSQGILLTRGAYTAKIVEKPGILFTIWSMSHCALFAMVWTYTFWFKKAELIQMMNSVDKESLISFKVKSIGFLTPCFVFMYYMVYLVTIVICGRHDSIGAGFKRYTTRGFYELFIIKERNQSYVSDPGDLTHPELITTMTYIGIRTYGMIIIGMTCAIIYFSAYAVDQTIMRLLKMCDLIESEKRENTGTKFRPQDIMEAYFKVKRFVNLVNKLNRPFLLLLCSANVPFFARRLIATFDTGRWNFKIIILINLVSHLVPFAMSAEAYHKAGILKTRILDLNHKENEGLYSKMILRDEIGLEGGGFFTVSYGFLGSVASACLSYAILLLQMQPPSNCGSGEEDF